MEPFTDVQGLRVVKIPFALEMAHFGKVAVAGVIGGRVWHLQVSAPVGLRGCMVGAGEMPAPFVYGIDGPKCQEGLEGVGFRKDLRRGRRGR